jgi:uncharacterized protein (TIRG00374 family)
MYIIMAGAMHIKTKQSHFGKRQLFSLLLFALFGIAVYSQASTVIHSVHMIRHAQPTPIVGAFLCVVATYLCAAATYYFLTKGTLPYWRTCTVQLAAMFINRLLPSGIGAIGANFAYLKRQKFRSSEAVTIVSLNNLLGFAGHGLVLVFTLAVYGSSLPAVALPHGFKKIAIGLACILAIGLLVITLRGSVKRKAGSLLRDIRVQLVSYKQQPQYLLLALGSSTLLTLANIGTLALCVVALGSQVSFVVIVLAFTFGISAGAALPTPGGIGGVEAGIAAALIAYHVPPAQAIGAVIVFRLASYWLPLLIGGVAFVVSQRRHYLG